MSASKINFFQGIALLLKEMSKTFTDLSKRIMTAEEKLEKTELQLEAVIEQHVEIVKQVKMISMLQTDIASQVVRQHQETEALYKALGLKKDISHYSFNMMNEEEH